MSVEDAADHDSECGIVQSVITATSQCTEFGCRVLNVNYLNYEHLIKENIHVWLFSKPSELPSCLLYFMSWKLFELRMFDNEKCSI